MTLLRLRHPSGLAFVGSAFVPLDLDAAPPARDALLEEMR